MTETALPVLSPSVALINREKPAQRLLDALRCYRLPTESAPACRIGFVAGTS